MAPSAKVTWPVLSILIFSDAESESPVENTKSVELTDEEKVASAFKLILSDKNVEGILINIFGGIMRCDILAQGVVDAAKEINLSVPLVVRLAGTNFKEGKEILDKSNLKILSASDLNDAAKKIVEAIS